MAADVLPDLVDRGDDHRVRVQKEGALEGPAVKLCLVETGREAGGDAGDDPRLALQPREFLTG
jgi:hypothetical protein